VGSLHTRSTVETTSGGKPSRDARKAGHPGARD